MSTHQQTPNSPLKPLPRLPVEIQTQIYQQYYAKPWTFYAQDHHFNALQPRKQPSNPLTTNPSINLLLTCRAVNEIASPLLLASYNKIVSLVAVENFNEYKEWAVFLSTCQTLLAPATIFHIRLDQASHFSAWGLIHELQEMEAQNFKTVVMEDYFVVKREKPVNRECKGSQVLRLPYRLLKKVITGRYLTAEPWGVDVWRRDYNSHHLRYPIQHRYLIRFRVDQPELRDNLFEVELELTTEGNMDMAWKSWLVLREDARELGIYAKGSEQWEVLYLDHVRVDARLPIFRLPESV